MGGGEVRPPTRPRDRAGPSQGERHRGRWCAGGPSGKASDRNDPHRHRGHGAPRAPNTNRRPRGPRRLPTVFAVGEFVEAGGLLAYGPSLSDSFRRAATYVDKILKGARPADLPIEQPTTFELVVNL